MEPSNPPPNPNLNLYSNHEICKFSKKLRKEKMKNMNIDYSLLELLLAILLERRKSTKVEKLKSYFDYEVKSLIAWGLKDISSSSGPLNDHAIKFLISSITMNNDISEKYHKVSAEFQKLKPLKSELLLINARLDYAALESSKSSFWKLKTLLLEAKVHECRYDIHTLGSKFMMLLENDAGACLDSFSRFFLRYISIVLDSTSISVLIASFLMMKDCEKQRIAIRLFLDLIFTIVQSSKKEYRQYFTENRDFIDHSYFLIIEMIDNPYECFNSIRLLLQILSILYSKIPSNQIENQGVKSCKKLCQFLFENEQEGAAKLELSTGFLKGCVSFIHCHAKDQLTELSPYLGLLLCLMQYSVEIATAVTISQTFSVIYKSHQLVDEVRATLLDDISTDIYESTANQLCIHLPVAIQLFGVELYHFLNTMLILLENRKSRTAINSKIFKILLEYPILFRKVSAPSNTREHELALLFLKFTYNASKDSSLRFKIKAQAIPFFSSLFLECCRQERVTEYFDSALHMSALFVNEFFGHDVETLDTLTAKKVPLLIIKRLRAHADEQLEMLADDNHAPSIATLQSMTHLLDSSLRTEKAKKWLISSPRLIEDLVVVAIRSNGSDINSVVSKFLARVMSDPSLTIPLCEMDCFFTVFNMLLDPINYMSSKLLLSALETRFELMKEETIVTLIGLYEYSPDFNVLISIALVAPVDLLKGLYGPNSFFTRPLSRSLLGRLIENYETSAAKIVTKYFSLKAAGIVGFKIVDNNETQQLSSILASTFEEDGLVVAGSSDVLLLSFPDDSYRTLAFPKYLLLEASPPFKAMFEGPFSESGLGKMILHDSSYRVWEIVLLFLSGRTHAKNEEGVFRLASPQDITLITEVLLVAQKFLIDSLKIEALKWLRNCCAFLALAKKTELLSHLYISFMRVCQDETLLVFQDLKGMIVEHFLFSLN